LLLGGVLQGAWAQDAPAALPLPPLYAVISEVAREVSVVGFAGSIGTRLDNNPRERLPVPNGALDKVALLSLQQALKEAAPMARSWLLAPAETDFFPHLQSFAVGSVLKVPADLADAMKEQRVSHLLLLSRFRSEAEIRFSNRTDGKGQLEGLGYFVERATQVTDNETRETGLGYLAPFVYVRLTLVDASTFKVLNTKTTKATRTFGAYASKTGSTSPWDALSSAEKINTLRDMLMAEVQKLTPQVLSSP
jgi:hypothetical protein